jgi:hypothetical protein
MEAHPVALREERLQLGEAAIEVVRIGEWDRVDIALVDSTDQRNILASVL